MSGVSGAGGFRPNLTPTDKNISGKAAVVAGAAAGAAAAGAAGAIAGAAIGAAAASIATESKLSIKTPAPAKTPVQSVNLFQDKFDKVAEKQPASAGKAALKNAAEDIGDAAKIIAEAHVRVAQNILNFIKGQ